MAIEDRQEFRWDSALGTLQFLARKGRDPRKVPTGDKAAYLAHAEKVEAEAKVLREVAEGMT